MNEERCIEELLNGLNMGLVAIDHLIDKIENTQLRDIVLHQRKVYGDLKNKITRDFSLAEDHIKNKIMLESMIEMKTLMSDDHKIVKMLIEGSNQSVMTMTHLLNKEKHVDLKVKQYTDEFENISLTKEEAEDLLIAKGVTDFVFNDIKVINYKNILTSLTMIHEYTHKIHNDNNNHGYREAWFIFSEYFHNVYKLKEDNTLISFKSFPYYFSKSELININKKKEIERTRIYVNMRENNFIGSRK